MEPQSDKVGLIPKAPLTIRSSRFEACESNSVDKHLPLLLSRVHKQSGVTLGAHLKEPTPQKAVLHFALRLIEGGPGHDHGTWHSCVEKARSLGS